MRKAKRALIELTSWLTESSAKFFRDVPPRDEFGASLVALDPREIDASFSWGDLYQLELFPDVLTTEPRGILPPGYEAPLMKDPQVKYTFAIWSRRDRAPGEVSDEMWRHVTADLFAHRSQGVGRQRFARLATILDTKIPGHEFQHLMTTACAGELVSVFVDLSSMKRVARVIG